MACKYLKKLCRGSVLTVHNDFLNLLKKYREMKIKWKNKLKAVAKKRSEVTRHVGKNTADKVIKADEGKKCLSWNTVEEHDLLTVDNLRNVCNDLFSRNEGEDFTQRILLCEKAKGEVYIQNVILGQGNFGIVYLGSITNCATRNEVYRTKVAIKSVSFLEYGAKHGFDLDWKIKLNAILQRELEAMIRCMGHPNIVQIKFASFSTSEMLCGLEFAPEGDLFHYILQHGRVTEEQARIWFKNLASGFAFCHSKGIVHLDIKLENILIDEHYNVKISDFGLAMIVQDPNDPDQYQLLGTSRGTLDYLAPEMAVARVRDTRLCDVWSLAIVLFIMVAGFHPCRIKPGNLQRAWRGIIDFPPGFPPGPMRVIKAALVVDSQRRPTMKDLVQDKWVNGESAE